MPELNRKVLIQRILATIIVPGELRTCTHTQGPTALVFLWLLCLLQSGIYSMEDQRWRANSHSVSALIIRRKHKWLDTLQTQTQNSS